jgi:regulator of RNase E activity RraA
MRLLLAAAVALALAPACYPQLFSLDRDALIRLTPSNPFPRFDDGRPQVPNALLEKVRALSAEEAWAVLNPKQYRCQYAGDWHILHPERKLVGRAVTAQFMPARPDLNSLIEADAKHRNIAGSQNQWVIDRLQPGDVLVVDMFGKVENGTLVGDNLAAAIHAATGNGFLVDGGIRDLEGISPMPFTVYYRGAHPSAIHDVMLTGFNVPVRIGNATVMPGDVVLGDREGVYFIPPQFVQEIVDKAEQTHIHDEWTQMKLRTGKYKSSDLYYSPRDPALRREYEQYLRARLPKTNTKEAPSK